MIRWPLLQRLQVEQYGLFPGTKARPGIDWSFEPGLTLIAGINGLGKTTLLNMILRTLTGPFDLTGEGAGALESVLPPSPVRLNSARIRYFAQRVADDADAAHVTLTVSFGEDTLVIRRGLADLSLNDLQLNSEKVELTQNKWKREESFEDLVTKLFGLSSFVDVLLLLHHVVFFTEDRPVALWDPNAQRHILRALFLEKSVAAEVAQLERQVQSADSRARNISARAFTTERELKEARRRQEGVAGQTAKLEAEQKLLEADISRKEELERRLDEADQGRRAARLQLEKAKLNREAAENAIEEIKYGIIAGLFPSAEEAARLIFMKLLGSGECLLCGSEAKTKKESLQEALQQGLCPVCGSTLTQQTNADTRTKARKTELERAGEQLQLARSEEQAAEKRLSEFLADYSGLVGEVSKLSTTIEERRLNEKKLVAALPPEPETIRDMDRSLSALRRSQRDAESERATGMRQLLKVLEQGQSAIVKRARELTSAFREHVRHLLAEDAELVRIEGTARLTQGGDDFSVPAFVPEMSAANKVGLARRQSTTDVSESERELIDLAFRMSLIQIASNNEPCSFVIETPEASLDELAMERVGAALHRFAQAHNRLVATTNLTNASMVTSMFGGRTRQRAQVKAREECILNLLKIAAPNRALQENRREYERILSSAVKG